MKEEWKETTIGELCTIKSGTTVKKVLEESAGNVPYVKVADMNNEGNEIEIVSSSRFLTEANVNPKSLFPVGTTIFPKRGGAIMTNKKRLTSIPICCDLNIMGVIPPSTVHPQYLFYYFENVDMRGLGSGTTIPQINNYDIEPLSIFVPEFETQKRIVAILDEAFGAIARAKENAARNLANARELFDSYLNRVFTEKGEGWEERSEPLNDLCEFIVDCEHKTAPTQEIGIPSIRTPNIGKGELILEGVKRVSEETYKAWTRRAEPQTGDLILAREAPAGNVAVIPEKTKVCLGQRTVLIRPKKDVFHPYFLAYLILEPKTQSHLQSHATGATVQHINLKDIRALRVGKVPDLDTQRKICSDAETIFEKSNQAVKLFQQKLSVLDELKQSLLQKAFTGQLTSKSKELELVP